MDIFDRKIRYVTMVGYCRGNRIVLFKMSISPRILLMMRPFIAYMYRRNNITIISGNFRFSLSTKILACAWLLNDFIRLLSKLQEPIPKNFIGHIISLVVLPIFLVRAVWKDKAQQNAVMDYMKSELDAQIDK